MWQSFRFVGLHQLIQTASLGGAIMLAALLWFTASLSANDGPPRNDGQSATELPRTTSPSDVPNPQQIAEQTLVRERQLLDLLARPVSLDYQNIPLEKLLDDLAQRYQLPLVIDRRAITAAKIQVDLPATIRPGTRPLELSLDELLGVHRLGWTVDQDCLLISTERALEQLLTTRVYPIEDLVEGLEEANRYPLTQLIKNIHRHYEPAQKDPLGTSPSAFIHKSGSTLLLVARTHSAAHKALGECFYRLRSTRHDSPARTTDEGRDWLQQREISLRAMLNQPVTFNYAETSLKVALDDLQSRLKTPLEIDQVALDDSKLSLDSPINCQATDLPARAALWHLLNGSDIAWSIRRGDWFITSDHSRDNEQLLRVYPVDDLVLTTPKGRDFDYLLWSLELIGSQFWPQGQQNISHLAAPGICALAVQGNADLHEILTESLCHLRTTCQLDVNPTQGSPDNAYFYWVVQREQQLSKLFNRTISVDYQNLPLEKIFDDLSGRLGEPIYLDHKAFEAAAIDCSVAVSFRCRDLPLRSALALMLEPYDLTWTLRHGSLTITSCAFCEVRPCLRFFPIADLIKDSATLQAEFPSLIQSTVHPNSWPVGNISGCGLIEVPGSQLLTVWQTEHIQTDIEKLLAQLRSPHTGQLEENRDTNNVADQRNHDSQQQTAEPQRATNPQQIAEQTLARERQLLDLLARPVSLDYQNIPLKKLLDDLAQRCGTSIYLDRKALEAIAVEPSLAVSFRCRELPLRSALRLMLKPHDLAWTLRHEALLITSAVAEEGMLSVRVYRVSDLVESDDSSDDDLDGRFEMLIRVITDSVAPISWTEVGGSGSIRSLSAGSDQLLVVNQTASVHDQVAELLARLRAVRTTQQKRPAAEGEKTARPSKAADASQATLPTETRAPRPSDEAAQSTIPTNPQSLVSGNTHLSCSLYRQLVAGAPAEENVVFAPYGLTEILLMALGGAGEQTASEMQHVLGVSGSTESLAKQLLTLRSTLTTPSERHRLFPESADNHLSIANQFWSLSRYPIERAYTDYLQRQFACAPVALDLTNAEQAVQTINAWAKAKTHGQIDQLADSSHFTPDTRMVLANAFSFSGQWAHTFSPESTRTEPFFNLAGKRHLRKVKLMHQLDHFHTAQVDGTLAVELTYIDSDLSLICLLPEPGAEKFAQLERSLSEEWLKEMSRKLAMTRVDLYLPRFSAQASNELIEPLRKLGMRRAFDSMVNPDNFPGITTAETLYIWPLLQAVRIEVDERGTRAAAATMGGGVGGGLLDQGPLLVRFDRPFIYLLYHRPSGTILLLGRLMQPSAE